MNYDWIQNPFSSSSCTSSFNLSLQEEEELISISADCSLKIKCLDEFWISIKEEYLNKSETQFCCNFPFHTFLSQNCLCLQQTLILKFLRLEEE